jgi:hypothetical protein
MHVTAPRSGPPPSRAADEARIVQALLTVVTAFTNRHAEVLLTAYSLDADWIDDPRLTAASLAAPPMLTLRWLDDDAVIATTSLERRHHTAIDGRRVSRRRTHSLKVLTRSAEDRWLIVSDIYADARDPADTGAST